MDRLINETYWMKFNEFGNYVPPPKGTPERAAEGLEIEKRLLHMQRCCKELPKSQVLSAIYNDLKYFVFIRDKKVKLETRRKRKYGTPPNPYIRSQPFMIAYCITELLKERRTPEYSRDLRVFVACMFIAMKKTKLFDWD